MSIMPASTARRELRRIPLPARLWPFTLRSRARRLTVLRTALGLLVCRPPAVTPRKSALEPTTPCAPTPTRQRRSDSSCATPGRSSYCLRVLGHVLMGEQRDHREQ